MSVITIAANKGGVGKTTITALIASNLAKKKKKVYLIDLDPQQSLKQWWQKREDEDISLVDIKYNQLKDALAKISIKDSYVIIDTPPSHLKIIEQAILVADYILIPCRPSPLDIEAIGETLTIIEEHKKNFTFILNSSVSGTQITEQTILLLSKNGQIAPSPIRQRIIYAIAMLDGRTALEMHNKAAISEINELCNFIEGEIKGHEKKATKSRNTRGNKKTKAE